MRTKGLKITIVGDQFMRKEIVENIMHNRLKNFEIEIQSMEWELRNYQKQRIKGIMKEVKEFTGSPEQLIPYVSDTNILIVHVAPVTLEVMKAAKNLMIIGCLRANPVNVDVDAATSLHIPVLYAPGRNAVAVAEFVVGAIIAHIRNIIRASTLLRQGFWGYEFYYYNQAGYELSGKTIGIIGFGKVGREVAVRAKAFGMSVLVYDPYVSPDLIEKFGYRWTTLEHLLVESDIVSIHCTLTEETYHLIGEKELKKMKSNAIIVNTARGGIIDESALINALKNKTIGGAILDVFENEPLPPNNPFVELDNVTILPHIAGASKEVVYRASSMIAEDVERILEGRKPLYCMNPQLFDVE